MLLPERHDLGGQERDRAFSREEKLLMEEQLSAKLIEAKMEEVLKGRTKKGKQSTDSSLLLKNKLEKLSGGLYQHLVSKKVILSKTRHH